MTKVKLVPHSITKEMDAKEFVTLATKKPFLIRKSRFVPPAIGSGGKGWFIVEFENEPTPRQHIRVGEAASICR